MAGWRIFAAIVLAVLAPLAGVCLVYQVCRWLSYDAAAIRLLVKGLALALICFLSVTGIIVFCRSFSHDGGRQEGP